MIRVALAALALGFGWPAGAQAQAYRCALPQRIEPPQPDPSGPRRLLSIGGYTLAISWTPQQCRGRTDAAARFECGSGNRFGFTLHGLWPDGRGAVWPQYCRAAGLVDRQVVRATLCATPSVSLIQHEWAKHGTCMAARPGDYFAQARRLYDGLRYPDMIALSRQPDLTVARLAEAFAAANPGMDATMLRVRAHDGWLDELWLCLDTRFKPRRCPAHQPAIPGDAQIRIWRGSLASR